jgi:hypothetical protein
MWIATLMFLLFAAFLFGRGLKFKANVERLTDQLEVIERREAEIAALSQGLPKRPPSQMPLPKPPVSERGRRQARA